MDWRGEIDKSAGSIGMYVLDYINERTYIESLQYCCAYCRNSRGHLKTHDLNPKYLMILFTHILNKHTFIPPVALEMIDTTIRIISLDLKSTERWEYAVARVGYLARTGGVK